MSQGNRKKNRADDNSEAMLEALVAPLTAVATSNTEMATQLTQIDASLKAMEPEKLVIEVEELRK